MKLKSDYRISRESVAGVVKEKLLEVATDGITKAWLGCPASQEKHFFKRLTPGQKAIPLLQLLESEVYNGGFHQFFWNSSGNNSANVLEALLAIQAEHYASIFQKALAVLAVKGKLENRRQRQSALKLVSRDAFDEPDDAFYKLNDNESTSLEKLCAKYFQAHPEDFFLPAGTQSSSSVEVDVKDYRLPRKRVEKLSDENIHWLPIEKIWDDYWEAIKGDKGHAEKFIATLTPGQRALIAIQILNNLIIRGGFWEVLCFSLWPGC